MKSSSPALHGAQPLARVRARASRWPARLDWMQSASGLVLALFMWGHMFFVSSILLGKDAMWVVTKAFEGYFIFGRSLPWLVSLVVAIIFMPATLISGIFGMNFRRMPLLDQADGFAIAIGLMLKDVSLGTKLGINAGAPMMLAGVVRGMLQAGAYELGDDANLDEEDNAVFADNLARVSP